MDKTMILNQALDLLEHNGLSADIYTLLSQQAGVDKSQLGHYWQDNNALIYDCLAQHAAQIDEWHQQMLDNEALTPREKLLSRYDLLETRLEDKRFPGCLFMAACNTYPERTHPLHQLAESQKHHAQHFAYTLLTQLGIDNPDSVARQLELILEGCLSQLLVKGDHGAITTAKTLSDDIVLIALCRKNGALG